MISKSDLVILVLASSALSVAVYRWHQNTQDVSAITIPANSRVVIEEPVLTAGVDGSPRTINSSLDGTTPQSQTVTSNQVIVAEPVTEIIVGESTTDVIQYGTHRVRSGESLSLIAQQYGTDVNTLREMNGISGSVIQIGQEILYPQ